MIFFIITTSSNYISYFKKLTPQNLNGTQMKQHTHVTPACEREPKTEGVQVGGQPGLYSETLYIKLVCLIY